jgi:hypothetical protein
MVWWSRVPYPRDRIPRLSVPRCATVSCWHRLGEGAGAALAQPPGPNRVASEVPIRVAEGFGNRLRPVRPFIVAHVGNVRGVGFQQRAGHRLRPGKRAVGMEAHRCVGAGDTQVDEHRAEPAGRVDHTHEMFCGAGHRIFFGAAQQQPPTRRAAGRRFTPPSFATGRRPTPPILEIFIMVVPPPMVPGSTLTRSRPSEGKAGKTFPVNWYSAHRHII